MKLLHNKEISKLIRNKKLTITPILDKKQIKYSNIDLRLGNIFKVAMLTREGFIDISKNNIDKFFDTSYRDFGEDFILYPNQLVLVNSFEFLKLPHNISGTVHTRSSINRLGVQISALIHPGYTGILTLELINKGTTPIKLTCGMRIIQLSLFKVNSNKASDYPLNRDIKYIANTEPKVSNIFFDEELDLLKKI